MLIVRLNKGRIDSIVIAAVSKELMELDMGNWHKLVDIARHLVKCDYLADPPSYRLSSPLSLTFRATSG